MLKPFAVLCVVISCLNVSVAATAADDTARDGETIRRLPPETLQRELENAAAEMRQDLPSHPKYGKFTGVTVQGTTLLLELRLNITQEEFRSEERKNTLEEYFYKQSCNEADQKMWKLGGSFGMRIYDPKGTLLTTLLFTEQNCAAVLRAARATKPRNPKLVQVLQKTAAGMRKNLPLKFDDDNVLTNVSADGARVFFDLRGPYTDDIKTAGAQTFLSKFIIAPICSSPKITKVMGWGAVLTFRLNNPKGALVHTLDVSPDECDRVTK